MGAVRLECGEVLDILKAFESHSFHGLFSDPPYGLGTDPAWDNEVPPPEVWREVARVLVPGAWILSFGGRRTHHRLMASMEEGGLLLHDVLSWLYATGMTSSRTTLKPAWEPIVLARVPGGSRALNIDECRIKGAVLPSDRRTSPRGRKTAWGTTGKYRRGERHHPDGRWPKNALFGHAKNCDEERCTAECPIQELDSRVRGASRFYYAPKPVGNEAKGNPHPTKKPVCLCTYLARLIRTPGEGRLLVPYSGSGSELIGGLRAGWHEVVGIEREERWLRVAERRLSEEREEAA